MKLRQIALMMMVGFNQFVEILSTWGLMNHARIRLCSSPYELATRRLREPARVYLTVFDQWEGWTIWRNSYDVSKFILGQQDSKGNWFFMQVAQGRNYLILNRGIPPTDSVLRSDPRVFSYFVHPHSRHDVLKHVSSQRFVTRSKTKLLVTKNAELAENWCLHLFL